MNGGRAVVIYNVLDGDLFVGPLQVVEYNFSRGAMRKSRLHFDQGDACQGSPENVYLIDSYTLFSTHINPSAECLLLLDSKLMIGTRFYGFFPLQVAPGQVAIIENMVHFAPVHPERMQVINLRTNETIEIYPPANDPLRARLAVEHTKKMPPSETCMRMNDPCDPNLFDEQFSTTGTDGERRLAFLVSQSASHAIAENTEPETVVQQSVLYNYALRSGSWYYCQELISTPEVETLQLSLNRQFGAEVSHHCKPDRLVSPDMSTAVYKPSKIPRIRVDGPSFVTGGAPSSRQSHRR